jgi:hypothetical protein
MLYEKEGQLGRFGADSVYSCREIVASDKEEDWALIRMDRATSGRAFFHVRAEGEPALGTTVTLLGYPRGIPLKIGEGKVVANVHSDEKIYFEADLDAFGGNSGGPVVNAKTLELEGILEVAFGEFESPEVNPATGKPCLRPRHFKNPDEATPVWLLRAPRFARAVRDALARDGYTPVR